MTYTDIKTSSEQKFQFLSGGGEMGRLMRSFDWATTPIGTPGKWPQSLRITLSILLNSKFPMFLFWGAELICFYNDAYRPSLGENGKHPHILAQRGEDAWPDIWAVIKPLIDQVMNGGESVWFEDQLIPIYRNGKMEDVYWTFSYSPVHDESGSVEGVFVTCNETTEKIKVLKDIKEREDQLSFTINAARLATWDLNPLTKKFIGNERLKEWFGIQADDEIELNTALIRIVEKDRRRVIDAIQVALQPGAGNYETEYSIFNPVDSKERRVLAKGKAAFNEQNIATRFSGILEDVTQQANIINQIKESEKEFRQLANSLPALVWTANSEGERTFASLRWKEFTGLDPYDNSSFEKMVHPDDLGDIMKIWTDCLASGEVYKTQVRIKSKEGDYQWFYVNGEPIKDDSGKIEKWIGTFTNYTEQKKAQEELLNAFIKIEESEKRFRNVADNAPVLIWMAGTDKLCYFLNKAWLDFTGRSLEQEIGNGWVEGIHADDRGRCLDVYTGAFNKRESFYMEYRHKRNDGEYRWLSDKGVPRFTGDGVFEGYIGASMDIHDHVVYQKKLKDDEEKQQIIITASELGTWELNMQDNNFDYSEQFLKIFGKEERAVSTHADMLDMIHPDDLSLREQAFKEAYKTCILNYTSRIIWDDKSVHWIENRGKVFYDDDNKPSKIIGTTRDITEERTYQQELQQREQKFRLLADSMPQFVWTGDAEGNLNYFNQSVYNYSGLTPDQIEKEGWLQIVHPDDREENIKVWINSITTGSDFIFEHRFGRRDGEYRWQLSRAIPQRDASGNIQMWVGTSTDIQEMKELDQQKDFFISMASHELKTPITSIKGYVQMLQSTYGKNEDVFLKNALQVMDKQVGTLTNLISDLLDLSKIKSGKLVLNLENFNLNDLLEEVIDEIKHINQDYTITLIKKEEAVVNADRRRIGQVLVNFLTNAVKYSPSSKIIRVESAVENDNIKVSVEDSGIGISKADQPKIFERFYRVEGKNEKTFPGFGIGLFIASEIIHRHNGNISVKSEPGKGSVFYFSIPFTK